MLLLIRIHKIDYFNPRTHRGVRLQRLEPYLLHTTISIHAPIVGCDVSISNPIVATVTISIHAPIVGCDHLFIIYEQLKRNFNPRTHRGVRLDRFKTIYNVTIISIHAPIVGCDALLHLLKHLL